MKKRHLKLKLRYIQNYLIELLYILLHPITLVIIAYFLIEIYI